MKIVATSDLHGSFYTADIPECDLLIVAGDICNVFGSHEPYVQSGFLRNEFTTWLETLPAKEIVWIAGNHDFIAERPGFKENIASKIPGTYLQDEGTEVNGLKIWGTPWVPMLRNWAFYGDTQTLEEKFAQIPEDTDILVSHGPPNGVLDGNLLYHPCGSGELAKYVRRAAPKLHVFGHIHEAYGQVKLGETQFANVAHMDVDYQPVNPPIAFEIE